MKKKICVVLIGMILMAVLAVGCSAPASLAKEETFADNAVSEEAAEEAPAAAPEEESGLGALANANLPKTNRKLVYSAELDIETKNFDRDYAAVKTALEKVDGYVENEGTNTNTTEYGESRYSSMALRIPVASYNQFLDELSGIGTVRHKNISTEDMTSRYFDREARIEILEERQNRLMGHLREATNMEDIIKLESELSDVLYELDQYKGERRHMDDLVDYTQVLVSMTEVISAETITSTGDPLGERAARAYQLSLTSVGNGLQNFAVGMAAAAPVLMLLAVLLVAAWGIVKLILWLRKKSRARKESR